jgi:hypothetical protein
MGSAPLFAAEPDKPKLVVLIVFDQMRGDYLTRWQELYGKDGFQRLIGEGVWFTNCHYPYATTTTGPGHSSILTGATPAKHGIVNNQWYERSLAASVNCAQSNRYERVPAAIKKPAAVEEPEPPKEKEKKEKEEDTGLAEARVSRAAGSPDRLLSPTVGDALKEATKGRAKVFGISFKDRSALLPVGKKADGAYWLDSTDGTIITSSYYRDSVHPWVARFNKERVADQWFDKEWTRLLPDLDYSKYSGPDDALGESKGVKQGVTFPHPMHGGAKKITKAYYDALFNSPYGNEMLFELAKRAIHEEQLGNHDVPDMLVVGFSSNDTIGHAWGPDSQEVLDVTLRSDRLMAEFLNYLDKEVGNGKYLIALSADHGICPLPEASEKLGKDAKRLQGRKILNAAEAHLRKTFDAESADPKARWIEAVSYPWIYLNQKRIAAQGLKQAAVEKALAGFLAEQPGIARVFTRAELEGDIAKSDAIGQRMKQSFYPTRSGDVAIVVKPLYLFDTGLTGTNHGSPHDYDTYVPLVVFGTGVAPARRAEDVTPQAIAAIFAHALGIDPPKDAMYPIPPKVFMKQ